MAKTKSSITVAYNKAIREAGNIEDIARKIEGQKDKIMECRGDISRNWRGENANQYQRKLDDRERELSKICSDLRAIAATIKTVAKNTYNADMKAINLAQKRKYGGGGSW